MIRVHFKHPLYVIFSLKNNLGRFFSKRKTRLEEEMSFVR